MPPRYEVKEGDEPECPQCGKPMKLRVSKYGSHFWSCSTYPKCRGTMPYDTGMKCLMAGCEGTLVERLPRKRNVKKIPFWACNVCDFILSDRPLPTPCPECGHEYITEHKAKDAPEDAPPLVRCPSCGFEKEPVSEDAEAKASA
ncbi:MAG: topoisomerase DNA-binding C4 zinc finger domain-containing protein [Deltaproteobacteria bacterium]|nr:topoisomerase DNA-binding C4 zinc finger domain-containing protein [Deltaproteobacteria bacterium]